MVGWIARRPVTLGIAVRQGNPLEPFSRRPALQYSVSVLLPTVPNAICIHSRMNRNVASTH